MDDAQALRTTARIVKRPARRSAVFASIAGLTCAIAPTARAADAAEWAAIHEGVARRFWDAFNRAAWDELDPLVTATYRHHPPGRTLTLEQFKEGGRWVHSGLSGYRLDIDDMVHQRDRLGMRWTARGLHTGSFFGERPSGRDVVVQGMTFFRFANALIDEDHEVIDFDGFRRQLRP